MGDKGSGDGVEGNVLGGTKMAKRQSVSVCPAQYGGARGVCCENENKAPGKRQGKRRGKESEMRVGLQVSADGAVNRGRHGEGGCSDRSAGPDSGGHPWE